MYFEKPEYQIDCYSKDDIFVLRSFYTKRIEADFLTQYLIEFKVQLMEESKKNGLLRFVRESYIEKLALEAMRELVYIFNCIFKYSIEVDKKLANKVNNDQEFILTCGEFRDYKKPIFAIQKEIDLFHRDSNETLRARGFKRMVYENQELKGMDLKGSSFYNCKFLGSTIIESSLSDCIFDNCIFIDSRIQDTSIHGATFLQCEFKNTIFERVTAQSSDEFDLYKYAEILQSTLENTSFLDCGLEHFYMDESIV